MATVKKNALYIEPSFKFTEFWNFGVPFAHASDLST
jgi:hypothetical protein